MGNYSIDMPIGMHFWRFLDSTAFRKDRLRLRKTMSMRMRNLEPYGLVLVSSQGLFRVGVKERGEKGYMWLTEGWSRFAEAHQLKRLDFITFRYDGENRFKVNVFDVSSCPRGEGNPNIEGRGKILDLFWCENEFLGTAGPHVGTNAESWRRKQCFEVEIQKNHKGVNGHLEFPAEFVEATKLDAFAEVLLVVNGLPPTKIVITTLDQDVNDRTMATSTGWRSFLAENKIKIGDFLVFESLNLPVECEEMPALKVDIARYGEA